MNINDEPVEGLPYCLPPTDLSLHKDILASILFDKDESICYGMLTYKCNSTFTHFIDPSMNCLNGLYDENLPPPPLIHINPASLSAKNGVAAQSCSPRTMLFEMDSGSGTDQFLAWQRCGIPFTVINYTGNKSLHVLVRLETPLPLDEYECLHKAITTCLRSKFNMPVDTATCKPNLTTKIPGFIGKAGRSRLIAISNNATVSHTDFAAWAVSIGVTKELIIASESVSGYRGYNSFTSQNNRKV